MRWRARVGWSGRNRWRFVGIGWDRLGNGIVGRLVVGGVFVVYLAVWKE